MWKWIAFLVASAWVALEVAVLMWVGHVVGLGWTLAWIFGSSLLGIAMVRVAGLHGVVRIHRKLRQQELPTEELLEMALILIGGCMLIAPGFLSDAIGLLLLVPPVRWGLLRLVRVLFGALQRGPHRMHSRGGPGDDVIEVRAGD